MITVTFKELETVCVNLQEHYNNQLDIIFKKIIKLQLDKRYKHNSCTYNKKLKCLEQQENYYKEQLKITKNLIKITENNKNMVIKAQDND